MKTTDVEKGPASDIAIFGRILTQYSGVMAPNLARYVLTLGFSPAEQAEMQELAARNQQGNLSESEHDELMAYVKAGHLLALLHSKARSALKKRKSS